MKACVYASAQLHAGQCKAHGHQDMQLQTQIIDSLNFFCFQVLPFASEETLRQLEVNLSTVPSVTELLHQGLAPTDITDRLLDGIGLSEGPASTLHPR